MSDFPLLQVREDMYFATVRYLADREGMLGEAEDRFDIHSACIKFFTSDYVRSAFEDEVSRAPSTVDFDAMNDFVGGVMYPTNYNDPLGGYESYVGGADPLAVGFVRGVAFSFLSAWVHRYGPVGEYARVRKTSVSAPPGPTA